MAMKDKEGRVYFEEGDRVRVIAETDGDTALGQVGTAIETSMAPWIRFDEPTKFQHASAIHASLYPDWQDGHMDCLPNYALELVVDG